MKKTSRTGVDFCSNTWTWILLIAVIVFVSLIRIRLLGFPLERDEGEYAYFGQLLLEGIPPYDIAYNMKFPGVYFMYASIMYLFGQTVYGIHFGLLLVNAVTIVLVYALSKKFVSEAAAIASCATYAALSLSPSVLGFAAHSTHFVNVFMIAGFLVLLKYYESKRFILCLCSGLLFGLAVLMKQTALLFCVFGIVCIVFKCISSRPFDRRRLSRDIFIFMAGCLLPVIVTVMYLKGAGVFNMFWFWTITYAFQYGSQVSLSEAPEALRIALLNVIDGFELVWFLSVFGLIVAVFYRRLTGLRGIILSFVLFSCLFVCTGFYFRQHYFITLLPAIAILAGIAVDHLNLRAGKQKIFVPVIFMAAVSIGIVTHKGYCFIEDPVKLCRTIYGLNPFTESIKIAEYIKSRSGEGDKIAIFGSEPQIYFYSSRRSATGYIYMYNLMEKHGYSLIMQKEMIKEIESADPEFVIYVRINISWMRRPYSEDYLISWIRDNITREKYEIVGIADICRDGTIYKWDGDAKNYHVISNSYVKVFRRLKN